MVDLLVTLYQIHIPPINMIGLLSLCYPIGNHDSDDNSVSYEALGEHTRPRWMHKLFGAQGTDPMLWGM